MSRVICPISNKPLDIYTHGRDAVQVKSVGGRWFSSLFTDPEEAVNWKNSFKLREAVKAANEELYDGKVRLVGEGWLTEYMTKSELTAWRSKLTPQPKRKPNVTAKKPDLPTSP